MRYSPSPLCLLLYSPIRPGITAFSPLTFISTSLFPCARDTMGFNPNASPTKEATVDILPDFFINFRVYALMRISVLSNLELKYETISSGSAPLSIILSACIIGQP